MIRSRRKVISDSGFSLVELVIGVAIVGIAAAIIYGFMGAQKAAAIWQEEQIERTAMETQLDQRLVVMLSLMREADEAAEEVAKAISTQLVQKDGRTSGAVTAGVFSLARPDLRISLPDGEFNTSSENVLVMVELAGTLPAVMRGSELVAESKAFTGVGIAGYGNTPERSELVWREVAAQTEETF